MSHFVAVPKGSFFAVEGKDRASNDPGRSGLRESKDCVRAMYMDGPPAEAPSKSYPFADLQRWKAVRSRILSVHNKGEHSSHHFDGRSTGPCRVSSSRVSNPEAQRFAARQLT